MSDSKPTCNMCGEPISWDETVRKNFGIKGPLEPDKSKKHTCDEQKKKEYQAKKSAEAAAREKAAAMGGNGGSGNSNSNGPKLESQEVYLKGILEESRRQTDLLVSIRSDLSGIAIHTRKTSSSHEWFEKLLQFKHRDEGLPLKEDFGIPTHEEIEIAAAKGDSDQLEVQEVSQ